MARATVNLAQGRAFVEYAPGQTTVSALHDANVAAGYRSEMARARFKIEGITCASCVTEIETALRAIPGVRSAAVSVGTEEAVVEYVPSAADVAAIEAAVGSAGYKVVFSPLLSAFAMSFSSVTVIANANRLKRWTPRAV